MKTLLCMLLLTVTAHANPPALDQVTPAPAPAVVAGLDDCTRLRMMGRLGAISALEAVHVNKIKALIKEVCTAKQPMPAQWSNGNAIRKDNGRWFYPNGRWAHAESGQWYYNGGQWAQQENGRWYYPSGQWAKNEKGQWYLPDGKKIRSEMTKFDAGLCLTQNCTALKTFQGELQTLERLRLIWLRQR